MSSKCRYFEAKFAEYLGQRYSVFCNSGSSADLLAISSVVKSPKYKLNKGDHVLVPAITWPTQIWAIRQAGLIPILYDCNVQTFNPDITTVPEDILTKASAVFSTHILGTCEDMDVLQDICDKYDLVLLEDTCESLGAKYDGRYLGTFGVTSTFSTFFSHHITTMEGGLCVTNCEDLYLQQSILRAHGWTRSLPSASMDQYLEDRNIQLSNFTDIDQRYLFVDEGYNLRPTEIQASFGIHQLKKLPSFNHRRTELASYFYSGLSHCKHITPPSIHPKVEPSFMALPLTILDSSVRSQQAISFLENRGVETRPLIAGNIMKHPVSSNIQLQSASDLPGAVHHHEHSFYVGLSPLVSDQQIQKLLTTICELDSFLANL